MLVTFLCVDYALRKGGQNPMSNWDDDEWGCAIIISFAFPIAWIIGLVYIAKKYMIHDIKLKPPKFKHNKGQPL